MKCSAPPSEPDSERVKYTPSLSRAYNARIVGKDTDDVRHAGTKTSTVELIMTSERQRVPEYLVGYAGEHDWAELWPKVVGARAALAAELVGVTEEQAAWRPPSGDGESAWSINEVVRHVLTYTANVAAIIEATAAGTTVTKDPPGKVRDGGDESIDDLLAELTAVSSSFAGLPQRVSQPANLDVTVNHAAFGPLNCRSWFLFPSIHDGDHTRHIQALKEMPGYPS